MDRVRKGSDSQTATWLLGWTFRVRTWAKIIDTVLENHVPITRQKKTPSSMQIRLNDKQLLETHHTMEPHFQPGTFSPLRAGEDHILCNDARLSYMELGTLVSQFTGWDLERVLDDVIVRLHCSARVLHSSGETRTYWCTDTQYRRGCRRDKVEIDLGRRRVGVAELTSFIELSGIDGDVLHGAIIRWMDKSPRSTETDEFDRPLCPFPLSFNHCLWRWADAGRNRASFGIRGFRATVDRHNLWRHVSQNDRQRVITSELRARYDIIRLDSIKRHVNVHEDPSTGDMLQTLNII